MKMREKLYIAYLRNFESLSQKRLGKKLLTASPKNPLYAGVGSQSFITIAKRHTAITVRTAFVYLSIMPPFYENAGVSPLLKGLTVKRNAK